MEQQDLIPHLFRTEYRKIVSVLIRRFGFAHMETAEDITSETFLAAAQNWGLNGLPPNPVAWLYTVAGNKAKNMLRRSRLFKKKITPELTHEALAYEIPDIDLSPENINDSQLQMMFAICHPSISAEAQIGLCLRVLCGFGIDEIANALLSNRETINKRLFRAKEKLRSEHIKIEIPGKEEINKRLDNVLIALYLLFNEGYYSESNDLILRDDFCKEAIRLTYLLTEHTITAQPTVFALLSLMCFHASRFEARKNNQGEFILYEDQDESLWNQDLIAKGVYFLKQASTGNTLARYHLEATIAYWHTIKEDSVEKWVNILYLLDRLLEIEYSPIAALNRLYAYSKVHGKQAAIGEAEKLNMSYNHFYQTLMGELYTGVNNKRAEEHLRKAYSLAKTQTDKQTIEKKREGL